MEVVNVSEKNEQKPVLYHACKEDFYLKKNISFLAVFWLVNKMIFYTSFAKKYPVSRKKLNIDNSKDDKNILLGWRIVFGCFMLGVILLGCGIPFLCLDILFKLAIAMTVIGTICSAIYLVIAILVTCAIISNAGKGELKLKSEDIPKGYELGDSIIPMKPKEKEIEDKNKKEYEIK